MLHAFMQCVHLNDYKSNVCTSMTIKSAAVVAIANCTIGFVLSTVKMTLTQFLLACCLLQICFGQTVINVATGVHSTKRESNGLTLPATSGTFQPIGALTTRIHLTKPYTVFVHYQLTIESRNAADFWSKLQVNHFNAGSLVHSGTQRYKTATGFWAANLNPGYYTFEVHYKSSVSISVYASRDWQTAVINVMWFEDSYAVSDGIKCYPTPITLNTYNNLGPIQGLEEKLQMPTGRAVIAAYQLSLELSSQKQFVSKLNINGQYEESTTVTEGNNYYLSHYSLLVKHLNAGLHYLGVTYRTATSNNFTDCTYNYNGNTNLFAVYLPSSCSVRNIFPQTTLSLTNTWQNTDLTYKLSLSRMHHVFIRYQFSKLGRNTYTIARLVINSVIQPHTRSIKGNSGNVYAGLFGFWQGSLSAGTYQITLQHTSNARVNHDTHTDYLTRAMDLIYCY